MEGICAFSVGKTITINKVDFMRGALGRLAR